MNPRRTKTGRLASYLAIAVCWSVCGLTVIVCAVSFLECLFIGHSDVLAVHSPRPSGMYESDERTFHRGMWVFNGVFAFGTDQCESVRHIMLWRPGDDTATMHKVGWRFGFSGGLRAPTYLNPDDGNLLGFQVGPMTWSAIERADRVRIPGWIPILVSAGLGMLLILGAPAKPVRAAA